MQWRIPRSKNEREIHRVHTFVPIFSYNFLNSFNSFFIIRYSEIMSNFNFVVLATPCQVLHFFHEMFQIEDEDGEKVLFIWLLFFFNYLAVVTHFKNK